MKLGPIEGEFLVFHFPYKVTVTIQIKLRSPWKSHSGEKLSKLVHIKMALDVFLTKHITSTAQIFGSTQDTCVPSNE
jgi:hypothetical protein